MKLLLLITTALISLNAQAQTAEETYLSTLLDKVISAVEKNPAESQSSQVFDAYCSILKNNANIPELTASVLGVNYHAKTGKLRKCRKACIWDSANAEQRARLQRGLHSSLAFKLDTFLTPALRQSPVAIIDTPQASRSRYSAELPISFPGNGLNAFFIITNLDRPDEKDAKRKYMDNYFVNGPYKDFSKRIFLYNVKFSGLNLRDFYSNDYEKRWNDLIGLEDKKKVEKILEHMDTDTIQIDGNPYFCK